MLVHELKIVSSLSLPFLLSMPAGTDRDAPGSPAPILIFLHGHDEGPPAEIYAGMTAYGPLKPGNAPIATRDFILAAPQLPARGDLWHAQSGNVRQIATYLQESCGGDPRRTYLTGFSYGGNGVFEIALDDPSVWTALWAVDPTRVPVAAPPNPIWFSSGEVSRRQAGAFRQRLRLPLPGTEEDDRVYLDEGLDHVLTAYSAYKSDRTYAWLLSRRS